jgi:hypothetical protein
MALTSAEKQRHYRERQSALAQSRPDVVEQALLAEVEHAGDLSVEERVALADKLADLANQHLWRPQKLAEIARKLRPPGWNLRAPRPSPQKLSRLQTISGLPRRDRPQQELPPFRRGGRRSCGGKVAASIARRMAATNRASIRSSFSRVHPPHRFTSVSPSALWSLDLRKLCGRDIRRFPRIGGT